MGVEFEEWYAKQYKKDIATHADIYGKAWAVWQYQQARIDALSGTIKSQKQMLDTMSKDLREHQDRIKTLKREINANKVGYSVLKCAECGYEAETEVRARTEPYNPPIEQSPEFMAGHLAALQIRIDALEAEFATLKTRQHTKT